MSSAYFTNRSVFRYVCIVVLGIQSPTLSQANDPVETDRCAVPTTEEKVLTYDDFRMWDLNRKQISKKFDEIYRSNKRLLDRARWNQETDHFELIFSSNRKNSSVPISADFIDAIKNHIERGLNLNYFDHVFFPDMGHAHLLIPTSYYKEIIQAIPVSQFNQVYTLALAHPDTRFLYHTAEQLQVLDDQNVLLPDKYIGWRYYTRNIVARNNTQGILDIHQNLESVGNTVCEVQNGYRYWGAGFYLSSSVNGCFPYRDGKKTYYFDISLNGLPSSANALGPMSQSDNSMGSLLESSHAGLRGAHACSAQ